MGFQRFHSVAACQQMSQSYSPCAPSALQPSSLCCSVSVLTFTKIGLCEVKLRQQKFQKWNALCRVTLMYREKITTCPEWLWKGASIKCRFVHLKLPVVAPETIEWEDFVSVWLHQLDFNETARGVQVQAARWTDIEVLIRPGNQESLTWRLLVGLYCWGAVIAFPSVSHMDGQRLAPPTPPTSLSLSLPDSQGVSWAFSLFLCRLMRSQAPQL